MVAVFTILSVFVISLPRCHFQHTSNSTTHQQMIWKGLRLLNHFTYAKQTPPGNKVLYYPQRNANRIRVKGWNPKNHLRVDIQVWHPIALDRASRDQGSAIGSALVNLSHFLCASIPPFVYSWRLLIVWKFKIRTYTLVGCAERRGREDF